jgi:hypothetical protein
MILYFVFKWLQGSLIRIEGSINEMKAKHGDALSNIGRHIDELKTQLALTNVGTFLSKYWTLNSFYKRKVDAFMKEIADFMKEIADQVQPYIAGTWHF